MTPMESTGEVPMLEIRNLKKYFPVRRGFFRHVAGYVRALDDVSLSVARGETLGIVGESGCGKTTLGKNLMLLQRPTSGEVLFHPERGKTGGAVDVLKLNRQEEFGFRKRIQMVFQDPWSSLNPSKTIFTSFDEPMKIHGMGTASERREKIAELLTSVNLQADYMYRFPHEFSGGQRQRICIARALCIDPEVLVCDEPVSALDVSIQAQVLNLMKDLQKARGLTYIFIAHDLSVVQYMSDRIAVMYLGQVVELARSIDLYERPLHPYTQALLSAVPVPEIGAGKQRIILKGDVPSPVRKPTGCPFHPRCAYRMDICLNRAPELQPSRKNASHRVSCFLEEPPMVK